MVRGHKAQRARERVVAVGVTFAAYGAIFFFLTRPSHVPSFRGVDVGEGVAVTLIGLGQGSSSAEAPDPLEAMASELSQKSMSQMQTPSLSQSARTSLSDLFGPESPASNAGGAPAQGAPSGVIRTGLVGDPGAQISGGRRNVVVGPDGQIAPCWRQPVQRVPVRMSIILDNQGGLIGPPEIVRPRNAARDEAQRAAETVAMRAMAGCAPFTLASAAGRYRSFELDFSKDRDWMRPTGFVELR